MFAIASSATKPISRPSGLLGHIAFALRVMHERRALSELDDRMLRDIGVSPVDAAMESRRSLFDLPRSR